MYRIKAPTENYERKIGGVRFVNGVVETEDAWLASWFSGRPGFTVETVEPKGEEPEDKAKGEEPEDKAKGVEPEDKPKGGKRGRKNDDQGDTAGQGKDAAADGTGDGA